MRDQYKKLGTAPITHHIICERLNEQFKVTPEQKSYWKKESDHRQNAIVH